MKTRIQETSNSEIIRIVATYSVFGALWIYLSDSFVGWFFSDPAVITSISMYKGLLFIVCTATLLYVLIRRYINRIIEHTNEVSMAQQELASQKMLLDNVVEGTSDAIYVKDPLGRYLLGNSALAGLVNKPLAEIIGKNDTDLFAADEAQSILAKDRWLMTQSLPQTFEESLTTPIGKRFFLSTKGAMHGKDGSVTGLFGIARDITERKLIEETLLFMIKSDPDNSTENFFERLARYLASCLKMDYVCIDQLQGDGLEAQTLAVYNDGEFEDNLRYALKDTPCGDVVGKTICVFPSGVSGLFPRDASLQELQAESYVGTTLWSHNGQPIGLIAVIGRQPLANPSLAESILKLVSLRAASELERKQSDDAIRSSEERYRLLASITSDFVYSCASDGQGGFRLTWMAGATESITGYTIDELIGMGCLLTIVHPEDRQRAQNFSYNPIPGKKGDIKFRIISKAGEVRWLQETSYGEHGADNQLLRFGSSRDITEQEMLRDQLAIKEKLESLGLLAGGIAHNFNNILTGIIGNISLAQIFLEPDHRAMKPLADAEKASGRAAELARALLTFGQGGEPIKKVVSLRDLLDEAISQLPADCGVRVNLEIQPEVPAIEADAEQLEQAFDNIMINAVQAMTDGGLLAIAVRNELLGEENCMALPAGNYISISFTDQGCGIPDENLTRIFTPYFTTKSAGNGLGLPLAHSIVERHGGSLTVSSISGQGAVFTIYLPSSGAGKAVPEEVWSGTGDAVREDGAVLVMDDEEIIRELATEMLTYLGYRVTSCSDGREAIQHYELALRSEKPFTAVIMDLTIPGGMGGKEAARRILELDPGACLIVSSGYSTDPIMASYRDYGFCRAIAKPYSVGELKVALGRTGAE